MKILKKLLFYQFLESQKKVLWILVTILIAGLKDIEN